jgi:hypothetical protein
VHERTVDQSWGEVGYMCVGLPRGGGVLEAMEAVEAAARDRFYDVFREAYPDHEQPKWWGTVSEEMMVKKAASEWGYDMYTVGGERVERIEGVLSGDVHVCVEKVNLSKRNHARCEWKVLRVKC